MPRQGDRVAQCCSARADHQITTADSAPEQPFERCAPFGDRERLALAGRAEQSNAV
jgi:hypothetical protein